MSCGKISSNSSRGVVFSLLSLSSYQAYFLCASSGTIQPSAEGGHAMFSQTIVCAMKEAREAARGGQRGCVCLHHPQTRTEEEEGAEEEEEEEEEEVERSGQSATCLERRKRNRKSVQDQTKQERERERKRRNTR